MWTAEFFVAVFLSAAAPLVSGWGLMQVFPGWCERYTSLMLGLSAGLLLAIASLELIPEAVRLSMQPDDADSPPESNEKSGDSFKTDFVMFGIFIGYTSLLALEKFMIGSHTHGPRVYTMIDMGSLGSNSPTIGSPMASGRRQHQEHHHSSDVSSRFSTQLPYTVFLAFAIHSFADGFLIAGAFASSVRIGLKIAVAVLFHKFPDGFVIASVYSGLRLPNNRYLLYILIAIGSLTTIGALFGKLLFSGMGSVNLGFLLAYGSGNFIFLSLTAILPEVMERPENRLRGVLSFISGYFTFWILTRLAGEGVE